MAFIDDDHGMQRTQNRHDGNLFTESAARKRLQIPVFLVNLAVLLLAGAQTVKAQNAKREVFAHRRAVEIHPLQQHLLVENFDLVRKVRVQLLAIRMPRVAEIPERLFQNGIRRDKPHHRLGTRPFESVKDYTQRVRGDKSLSARRRNLDADMRHTRHVVLVRLHRFARGRDNRRSRMVLPELVKGCFRVAAFFEDFEIAREIVDNLFLVRL